MDKSNSELAEDAIKSLNFYGEGVDPTYLLNNASNSLSLMRFSHGYLRNKYMEIVRDLQSAKKTKKHDKLSHLISESAFNIGELINSEEYINSQKNIG